MKAIVVFHADKVEGMDPSLPLEIRANPPMTVEGMVKIHALVPALRKFAPFVGLYCSRLARAGDAVSVLSLAFDLDFRAIKGLGQHANKDGSQVVHYPGYENEDFVVWQQRAIQALDIIHAQHLLHETVLIAAHRPTIAGMVGYARGVQDGQALKALAIDPALVTQGFVVLETEFNVVQQRLVVREVVNA